MSRTEGPTGPLSEAALDDLFAQARGTDVPLPKGLAERMVSDALAELPSSTAPVPPRVAASPREGLVRQLFGAIGGWPALAGLATATVAGIWIGTTTPGASLAETALGSEAAGIGSDLYLVDAVSAFDELAQDG